MRRSIPRMASVPTLLALAERGEAGRTWYQTAKTEISRAAALLDIPDWYYADLLALFSPRVSVRRNIRLTNYYITSGDFHKTTMRGVRAAVDHYESTSEIRGPKTSEFARALLGAGDAIVLDVWMARAFGVNQLEFSRPAVRARCEQRIRKVARGLGWSAAETQAAIWCVSVESAGRNPTAFIIVHDTLFGPHLETA